MEVGDPHLPLPVKVGYSRCGRLPPGLRLRGYHPLRPAIPGEFGCPGSGAYARIQNPTSPPGHPKRIRFGLLPFPSPVLGESRLISFPPPTRMFPFGGFAYAAYKRRIPTTSLRKLWAGYPIRAPADPRLHAPTRGFSQLATPFVAARVEPSTARRTSPGGIPAAITYPPLHSTPAAGWCANLAP